MGDPTHPGVICVNWTAKQKPKVSQSYSIKVRFSEGVAKIVPALYIVIFLAFDVKYVYFILFLSYLFNNPHKNSRMTEQTMYVN